MSILATDALLARAASNWMITLPTGNYINSPGHVLQTQWVRTSTQTTYAAAVTGNGTTISALAISITPKSSSSLLICSWMINYEVNTNTVFLAHKDGSLITTSGYQGYNNVAGNVRYSGLIGAMYDADNNSTPSNSYIQYAITSGQLRQLHMHQQLDHRAPQQQHYILIDLLAAQELTTMKLQ